MIPGVQRSQISFSFLQTYFAILLKHTRLILLLVAFSIEVAIFYYMFARPIYHVRALIEVKLLSKPTDDNVDYTQQEMYYTLQQQLQSDHILERTARRLGLHGHYEYIRRKYCKAIIVKTTSDNNMEVDIFAYSGELAQKWPRALYEAFEEYRQEKRAERREHQIKSWLYDRYKVENKLSELELKRKDLAEEMKEWEIKVGFVALKEVPKELVATRETLSQFEEIYQKLQDPNLDIDSRLALLERAQTEATVAIGEIVPGVQMKSKVEIYPQEGSSVILLP
ncbi:MAG: Wzz/FepE/Etk N-terminal domain-containing protein, partial [Candidatus Bathyarchaeia archaeon]